MTKSLRDRLVGAWELVAQIQSAGRPNYDRAVASGGTPEQAAGAALGYLAYSGRYFVDETTGDIRHEAKLSLVPNYLGQFHLRHNHLDGDQLTLSSELSLSDGRTVYSSLVWARAACGEQVV